MKYPHVEVQRNDGNAFAIVGKDDDGHHFLLPRDVVHSFDFQLRKIRDSELGSDDWYDAVADFCREFDQYMVG